MVNIIPSHTVGVRGDHVEESTLQTCKYLAETHGAHNTGIKPACNVFQRFRADFHTVMGVVIG